MDITRGVTAGSLRLENLGAGLGTRARLHWREGILLLFLGLAGMLGSYTISGRLDPVILSRDTDSVWFESDVFRVYQDMTTRGGDHYRTSVHPLFPLLTYPPTYLLRLALRLDPYTAVRLVMALVAALWVAALYGTLRLLGLRWLDAALFTLLGAASAAVMFWFAVPETYPLGSISILLAISAVALAEKGKLPWLASLLMSVLTLSFTLTNWMAGLICTALTQPWKRAVQITVGAFCVVVIAWGVQKYVFPSAAFFIGSSEEAGYVLSPESDGPLHSAASFVFHSMVLPAANIVAKTEHPNWSILSVQASTPGSGSLAGLIGVVLWGALLGLGLWSLFAIRDQPRLRLALGLTLLGQFALHLVYGDETFLYALHFAPLLILVAALTARTRLRPLALTLAGALVVFAGVNNTQQLQTAINYIHTLHSARSDVRAQMAARPQDPWPRGSGHVILAAPGTAETDKAYEEPGGSFSPSVGSFGVSLWVTDPDQQLLATSDSLPLADIQQQFVWPGAQILPSLSTITNYYQSLWVADGAGRWHLHLTQPANPAVKLSIVLRSVGPAGGPLNTLHWANQQLTLNNRWHVTLHPAPTTVDLGQEGKPGWMTARPGLTDFQSTDGWGYARFELDDGQAWDLTIQDPVAQPANALGPAGTQANLKLNLPDPRFAASLQAQVANLSMGLVGLQTRPGDPMNYPLAWQRDGAYEIAALPGAGQLDTAKKLSAYLAANDFYGGFGPEADAPGLAIWSLEQVAERAHDPAFEAALWPHVQRKADFIVSMANARQPIHVPVTGPVVPGALFDPQLTLVANAARNGLIQGRMDHEVPVLYVNAVSYRGLLDAAALADRLQQNAAAARWRATAAQLEGAWGKNLRGADATDDRTYIASLWPSGVVTASLSAYQQVLTGRWDTLRTDQGDFRATPEWTYFDVAEAHQWLYLDRPDRVWTTLEWFWDHQASPGLYTWWEGTSEENSFRLWPNVRGWVNPPDVTPHYWTAAEMLLLQLDMLAYTDANSNTPTLVIGAGIPAQWLGQPMSVAGLTLPQGQVDWSWDGQQVQVVEHGASFPVRLGPAFPTGTPLHVEALAANP